MKQSKNRASKFPEPIDIKGEDIIVKYGEGEGGMGEGEGGMGEGSFASELSLTLRKFGVAVVPIPVNKGEIEKAFKETKFYNTANDMFVEEHRVDEPTLNEFNNPSEYKDRKAGDNAQGMLHQYGTPLHTLIQSNVVVRETMEALYGEGVGSVGTRTIKYLPNRLRVCRKFKNNSKSLHIEAHELFEVVGGGEGCEGEGELRLIPGDIASLVGLTGVRRFVFWDMNNADLKPLKEYYDKHGSNEFTMLDPGFMHKHYSGRRRMVNIDCRDTPHMIVWQESNPHEIADSPSISLYISPVRKFNTKDKIKKVTSYQPIEYLGLTYHESNLLGLCYNMGGFEWPSGKKLYQFAHIRAYNHYLPKVDGYYKEGVNGKGGKFQQRLVRNGKVDQHTAEYRAKLEKMGIVLPDVAFDESTPNFVVDITELPIQILKDYGFIVEGECEGKGGSEVDAAEGLLILGAESDARDSRIGGHLH
jgi:hypothetical protein